MQLREPASHLRVKSATEFQTSFSDHAVSSLVPVTYRRIDAGLRNPNATALNHSILQYTEGKSDNYTTIVKC